MKIVSAEARVERFELTRPYTIAFKTFDSVENVIVTLRTDDGRTGLGAASPLPEVTGETFEACRAALCDDGLRWLVGRDVRHLAALCRELNERAAGRPAAGAAVDMALHDLLAQLVGVPLVDMLGRAHDSLPTSITIGIKPVDETLAEAEESLGRGFRVLKVKLGRDLGEDLARLARLRERFGGEVGIRVDPNQGYDRGQLDEFVSKTRDLNLEFIEQPMAAGDVEGMRRLPQEVRSRIAADESLLSDSDALGLVRPEAACGIFNIKLMKSGGVRNAVRIATIAELAGLHLMWGCMDESRISITAALHTALACPATRYLDLDGSLDLARDVADGGFVLTDGMMSVPDAPGLGLTVR